MSILHAKHEQRGHYREAFGYRNKNSEIDIFDEAWRAIKQCFGTKMFFTDRYMGFFITASFAKIKDEEFW